jgi:bifunctional enzyme CysN/CysC
MQSDLKPPPQTASTSDQSHQQKDLLRFITCGSVDDGKSTLIGRLLLDAGAIYDDQIQALQSDSERHGTNDGAIDTALLLDGLEDERQQGITIDVAYRYFTTEQRKFIIADTPGHEQFTRNMATGASTADLAIILVDASKGVLTQTKRHAFIVSLLGIKHIILAVNKMDLVDYDQSVFNAICDDFRQFAKRLDVPDIRFVPLSALADDNVVQPSSKTLWYADGSLLHLLESVFVGGDQNSTDFRFPVQYVNRPDAEFRGFSGTLASGRVRPGDEIVVLPSKQRSTVAKIVTMDGEQPVALGGDSITLTLTDEIDITRGDMIVRPANVPQISRDMEAMLVWMSDQALSPGRQCWMKTCCGRTSCEVDPVRYQVDVNTLQRQPGQTLKLNEVGRCRIKSHDPICYDSYQRNRQTGSFILVDRISHETVAAGMFLDRRLDDDESSTSDIAGLKLQPVVSRITPAERFSRYHQSPFTVLITGLSGAGKSTLAASLERKLFDGGQFGMVVDGENMRLGISRDLGFSADESSENLRRAAEMARAINESGQFCIAAFVAPQQIMRDKFRQIVGDERLFHVHLSTRVEVCRSRDTTNRYAAADRGDIPNFPGVTGIYDPPGAVDLVADMRMKADTDSTVQEILKALPVVTS